MTFPIDRVNQRTFHQDWAGDVIVCDIDRTYLYTRFSSLKGMARIPVEFAIDKRAIAGMVPLLKELRRGPDERSRQTPLYFISASPRQMRPVIERKMLMDGIEYDGTTFKDWGRVLRQLQPKRLKEQLGFKLTGLLVGRQGLPRGAREFLIGDDLESDGLAYAIYADVLAGRFPIDDLQRTLTRLGVARADAQGIVDAKQTVPDLDGVKRIYIRLERNDDPAAFLDYHPFVVPCLDPFQMAASMWAEGIIRLGAVIRVVDELARHGMGKEKINDRFWDTGQRGLFTVEQGHELARALAEARHLEADIDPAGPDAVWSETAARHLTRSTWTPEQFLNP